jgi:hypothetical protein
VSYPEREFKMKQLGSIVLFQNDHDNAINFSYINIKVLSVFHTSCEALLKQHCTTSNCRWRKDIYRTADKEWSSSIGVG